MLARILTVLLVVIIMGLLVVQRVFSLPPEVLVSVSAIQGDVPYEVGESLPRGHVLDSGSGYIKLTIEKNTSLWVARDTTVELHRLYTDELALRLKRGRIVVDHHGDVPLEIVTNQTSHFVLNDLVTFVNYDFLETIHVIPFTGAVQTYIEATGEHLLTPAPISIHETDPVTYSPLQINLQAGDAADFYTWTGVLTQE